MELQKATLTHESEGVPAALIPVGVGGDQTEPSKRKASPWSSNARQSVAEGQSTAPKEKPLATAVGDDQPVGAVVVVVECPMVGRVEDDVVGGPAADVQAAMRRATPTTEIGGRIRSNGLGGRWCRLIGVGPGGSGEERGGPRRTAGCPLDHSDGMPLPTVCRCGADECTPADFKWW